MTNASATFYYHLDPLNTVTDVTNASGAAQWRYTYEGYGAPRTTTNVSGSAPENRLRFNGQYLDAETSLYHLRARQYDPATGRFGALDPVENRLIEPFTGAYVYVNGQPTVGVDPLGLSMKEAAGGGGGLIWRPPWVRPTVPTEEAPGGPRPSVPGASSGLAPSTGGAGTIRFSGSVRGPGVAEEACVARIHGNSANSPARAYLYRLYNAETGEYLKTGVTQNAATRYSRTFMIDKRMEIIGSGTRRQMLDMERAIVERNPGPLNREPWAGRHGGP